MMENLRLKHDPSLTNEIKHSLYVAKRNEFCPLFQFEHCILRVEIPNRYKSCAKTREAFNGKP